MSPPGVDSAPDTTLPSPPCGRCSPRSSPSSGRSPSSPSPRRPRARTTGPRSTRGTSRTRASCTRASGVYYAFATQNFAVPSQTINIQVSTSPDGYDLDPLNGVGRAAPSSRSWAKAGETWAPSVALQRHGQRLRHVLHGDGQVRAYQCIGDGHRSADDPLGPYTHVDHGLPGARTSATSATRRQHRPQHLHRPDNGNVVPDLEETTATTDRQRHGDLVRPTHPGPPVRCRTLPPTISLTPISPGRAASSRGPTWYYLPGPDPVAAAGRTTSSTPAATWAPRPTPSDGRAAAARAEGARTSHGPLLASAPGVSGPGGPDVFTLPPTRSIPPGRRSWPSPAGRATRSATSRAASGPCTWPT